MNELFPNKLSAAARQALGRPPVKGAVAQLAPETSEQASVPLADLFQSLHSTAAGLSAADAAAILKTVGPNRTETAKPKTPAGRLYRTASAIRWF